MEQSRFSDGTIRLLRRIAIALGIGCILVSFIAESVGLSVGNGMSANQLAIICVGSVLILAGIAGRKFPAVYRALALILLNTIAIFVLLDLLSLVLLKLWNP